MLGVIARLVSRPLHCRRPATQFLGPGTTNILPAGPLPPVNEHELRAREAHTMRLAQRQASNTNADVPTAVQTLFDRIANT